MKNWLSLILLTSVFSVNAQVLTDYEYIIIPESFKGFDKNQYGLKNRLNQELKNKKYKPLSFNSDNWPTEIKNNPCTALRADIIKERNFLNNKLNVTFSNCHEKVIFESDGLSKIKEYEPGFQEALMIATNKIPVSNPKEIVSISIIDVPKTTTEERLPELGKTQNNTSITKSLKFRNGNLSVDKIDLKDGGFMLMNPESSQIIAKFYPSSKANVFRVVLTQGNTNTIGYVNENSISYEIIENNNVKEVIFKAE